MAFIHFNELDLVTVRYELDDYFLRKNGILQQTRMPYWCTILSFFTPLIQRETQTGQPSRVSRTHRGYH